MCRKLIITDSKHSDNSSKIEKSSFEVDIFKKFNMLHIPLEKQTFI